MERTHATIAPACYNAEAREDFVSRGLAVRTLGAFGSGIVLLEIEGNREQAQRWISDFGGDFVEPNEQREHTSEERHTNAQREALALVESALESFSPAEALEYGSEALALVGLDGLDEIASTLANENRIEEAYTLRGALAALVGEPLPPEIGGEYESESEYGFRFVRDGGAFGAWKA